ncbi:T9SS type A sorting domain-containing protein [Subsaxibacter sp. CAU 1640]|uniref:T9SS type A sorting domain-containing protein n=1 Tax=Subsaxibacter sp. CAU 1640 TaxID=2933271 RepID=UPI0020066659|nr:T9SS type A sorting domain-containing protein [Subsaxibacter sp. CAU 1640]MCK7590677.1 T9SS type A sorting domain-containing protein [Subsaxibacter sp. CAU 1640]
MKKITFIFVLISYASFAQQYTYVDFGITTNTTTGNWNNVAVANAASASGITLALVDDSGASTGVTLTVDDAFNTVNTAGNPTPDASLPFPSSAAADSFFGNTAVFQGATEPTGGFTLTGLDPTKYYSFSIFASRNNVSDNREAIYTVAGSSASVGYLNASNNTMNTATVMNIQPNGSNAIVFTAAPGPNNDNGSGFYYLGAIEMITSDAPLSVESVNLISKLNVFPNPVSDRFEVKLFLNEASNLKIEMFDINGRLVQSLLNEEQPAGDFSYVWERNSSKNTQLSAGTYILEVTANNKKTTSKLIIK